MKMIPYGRHSIDSNDIKSVSKALRQEKITSGNEVLKFEKKLRDFLNVNLLLFATAVLQPFFWLFHQLI